LITFHSTGASAGIGEACAREFARAGSNLILTARRLERLEKLRKEIQAEHPNTIVHCAQLDVRDAAAVKSVVDTLPESVREVDIIINNAGLVKGLDRAEDVSEENVDIMVDTNVKGPLNVLRALLPGLRQRQRGHIINVGSVAGIEAYKGGSVYCATKHALNAITKALRIELMDTPIRVSEIKPGMVETEFSVVRFGGDKKRADQVYEGMTPLTAQDIAEIAVFIASRPQHVQIADLLVLATDQASATQCHRRPPH
jgi:3-hydroxy acid dehydrogenase/malonic semialdehyde reductase